jgi:Glycosyl hydrolases family 2, sugar binding domain/Glycosyl hydrolases family 2/Glycosyl hydrolases family 2, TIM barrel domain
MDDSYISLDGTWDFLHVVEDYRSRPVEWRSIAVPSPWQAQFPDLRMRAGTGLYRRQVDVPFGWKRNHIFLVFGAVFHITRVWVNGVLVGTHIGGFLPFSFDVTDHLNEGPNEIKVRADSPSDDPNLFPDVPFGEIPFGKQSWYGPLSRIWQSVRLERRIKAHISRVRIAPNVATGEVAARVFFNATIPSDSSIAASVIAPNGHVNVEATFDPPAGLQEVDVRLRVSEISSWSPRNPHLYRLKIEIRLGDQILDRFEESFGFRMFEARDGRFFLNGEPLYLRAALDQDYYPDTICTTPSIEFLEDQFTKAKQLGLNCIRCHIKAPDPRYYDVADRLGVLIWTELPNMGVSTERSRARKSETLKGIVDRDGNHPSIICWTIINENWGVDLVHDIEHRDWLKNTYQWLKVYDSGRLVVDNSPLSPSFHVQTDVADYHFYAAFPDSRGDWDRFVDQLASRPSWLFSPDDGVQSGQEPLVCSEFGNWGLPNPDLLRDGSGSEPWWFETGHDWAEGVMYAHGVENRFTDWSLGRVFGSLTGLVEAAQWQQFRALKYAIEAMRAKEQIAGYVITELTDAHWESNGLLDMRRNTRVFHDVFRSINADTIIVPKWTRLSYWSAETATFEVLIAHGAGVALRGAKLEISLDSKLMVKTPYQAAGTVASLGELSILLPEVDQSCIRRLRFTLYDAEGIVLASNYLEVAIHAARQAPASATPLLWSVNPELRRRLEYLGYRTATEPQGDALWLCTEAAVDASHVRRGGRILLLPESDLSLTPYFPHWQNVRVQSRDGTLWRGDWASTFSWLRRGHAFDKLPGGPLLDEIFDRVLPTRIISGCNLLDFQARVHAGMVIGWIHKPVALTVERGYGRGRLVASTFRLFRDAPGADPTATVLLDSLIGLALAEGSAASRERDEVLAELF